MKSKLGGLSLGRVLRLMAVLGLLIALVVSARASQTSSRGTKLVVGTPSVAGATTCDIEEHQEAVRQHDARVAADQEDVAEHGQPVNVAEDNAEAAAAAATLAAETREDQQEASGYGGCR